MRKLIVPIVAVFIIAAFAAFKTYQSEYRKDVISIGVVVSDMETSETFYKEVIGMKEVAAFTLGGDFGKKAGITDGQDAQVKMLKLGDSPDATNWKLLSFEKNGSHEKNEFVSGDIGMQYITLYVHSLKPILSRLEKNNVKLLGETPTPVGNGDHFVLIQDPDGTFIEIMGVL